MKTHLVLVEREDKAQDTVVGCSGLMLNDKYVIVTSNVMFDQVAKTIFEELEPGQLYTDFSGCNTSLNIVRKDNELYVVKKAKVFSAFISGNIKNSSKYIFQHWAIDSIDNNRDLTKIMSLFFVLAFGEKVDLKDFKDTLMEWWDLVIDLDIGKGNTIYCRSAPFANRNFIDSVSKGIVSNVLGNSSCLLVSDCPCAPGCEGSPVYLCDGGTLNKEVPIGLVLSCLSWWRGEWIGLTLIADIRPIILELVDISKRMVNVVSSRESSKLIATVECCLAQIYSGKSWGTAILLSQEKGIFITNSHVIENGELFIFHKGQSCDAQLIYKTPKNEVFDLAIIKSDPGLIKNRLELTSTHFSRQKLISGDTVYSAGYSLFPRECDPTPTISKGCISQVNPSMMKTTCCVHPGSSGGAILDSNGDLLGIIVCNARLEDNNTVYPRINMAVPFSAISDTILSFLETEDQNGLSKLHVKNKEAEFVWKRIEGKL